MKSVIISIPLRVISEANNRDCRAKKTRRAHEQRQVARNCSAPRLPAYIEFTKMAVTLTRIGKKTLDTDNLANGFKAVRDGVADAMRVDDGDKRITWDYEQKIGKGYGIEIRVEWE